MSKKIPLTRGQFAIVDDEDFLFLVKWKWCARKTLNTFYAVRSEAIPNSHRRFTVSMHRVINKTPDGVLTDHINGNGLDNRKKNLRNATRSQNGQNRGAIRNGSSKYKGVHWNKKLCKWGAAIKTSRGLINLGSFDKEKDAADAYNARSKIEFGEFHNEGDKNV